jgi:hypothetical protein
MEIFKKSQSEKDILRALIALSEEEKKAILARRTQESKEMDKRGLVIADLTNAEIADSPLFQRFCIDKGIEPTKRQAGKMRAEFFEWYDRYNKRYGQSR